MLGVTRHTVAIVLAVFLLIPCVPVQSLPSLSDTGFIASHTDVYNTELAREAYETVSSSYLVQTIRELSDRGPRPYLSDNNEGIRDWIVSRLSVLSGGAITTEVVGDRQSIIGTLHGTMETPAPAVMIGCHYDSVSVSPGANDDGSGVAATLELARVLSKHQWPLDILFCFWNAEELGLLGSGEMAPVFLEKEVDILVHFNIDMLLVENRNLPPDERVWVMYNSGGGTLFQDAQYWAELLRALSFNFGQNILSPVQHSSFLYWAYSDHYSFARLGYKPIVFISESGLYEDTAYHTSDDTWDNRLYNYTLEARSVSAVAAAIAFVLSRVPDQPTRERYHVTLGPGGSVKKMIVSTMPTSLLLTIRAVPDVTLSFSLEGPGLTYLLATESYTTGDTTCMCHMPSVGVYTLTVEGEDEITGPVDLDIEFEYESDIQGNGIPDSQEWWVSDFLIDSDNDSLSDGREEIAGYNRYDPDTDHDMLNDYDEQFVWKTRVMNPDSDFDLLPDGWEVRYGLDPLHAETVDDPDGDALTNVDELKHGTHPLVSDTDSDGMPDGFEVDNDLDPLADDSSFDPDNDWATNLEEYLRGTRAHQFDLQFPSPFAVLLIVAGGAVLPVAALALHVRRKRLPLQPTQNRDGSGP
ncbi:MAG: M28 family peptidase [Candidatus Thorarchaeota archaeon]|nr:M28 family peptidase [Candidatus Thorarchaeota archaeon]